MNSVLNQGLFG